MTVRSYGSDTDFGYVCTVTLTLEVCRALDNFWAQCVFTPYFFTQCWFSNFQVVFSPLYFFAMLEREILLFLSVIQYICSFVSFWTYLLLCFTIACGIILQTLVFVITLVVMQRKPFKICCQTDRQMDLFIPEFYFCLSFDNCYALLWTPNAYHVVLMRIFTPCLFFQCVFADFQCVITLLRALSVALRYDLVSRS